jgi:hypothetical protein
MVMFLIFSEKPSNQIPIQACQNMQNTKQEDPQPVILLFVPFEQDQLDPNFTFIEVKGNFKLKCNSMQLMHVTINIHKHNTQ